MASNEKSGPDRGKSGRIPDGLDRGCGRKRRSRVAPRSSSEGWSCLHPKRFGVGARGVWYWKRVSFSKATCVMPGPSLMFSLFSSHSKTKILSVPYKRLCIGSLPLLWLHICTRLPFRLILWATLASLQLLEHGCSFQSPVQAIPLPGIMPSHPAFPLPSFNLN